MSGRRREREGAGGLRCSSSAFKGSSASAAAGAQGPASKQPISFEIGLSPGVAQARRTRGWSERNALRWLCLLS